MSLQSSTYNYLPHKCNVSLSTLPGQASTNHKAFMLMGVFMKHECINVSSYLTLYSSLLYIVCMNFS